MGIPLRIGRAFGFIKTDSSPARIKQAFRNMKADPEVGVAKDLAISVPASRKLDDSLLITDCSTEGDIFQLTSISLKMQAQGSNCVILACLPGAIHQVAANELAHVFNLMYSCTEIMGEAEVPVADIYFKEENGIYVSILRVNQAHIHFSMP